MRGVGGAAINVPEDNGVGGAAAGNENAPGTGLEQLSFKWWNGAVPLLALMMLFALSKLRFGLSTDELKAALEAQARAPAGGSARSGRRAVGAARAGIITLDRASGRQPRPEVPRV